MNSSLYVPLEVFEEMVDRAMVAAEVKPAGTDGARQVATHPDFPRLSASDEMIPGKALGKLRVKIAKAMRRGQ